MAIVNEIKCARCDRKYSGVRSRCPYCGARRIGRGKYSDDSDNAKGKMLISVLIMAVFTVGAAILLFSTPTADAQDPVDTPSLGSSVEDDINSLPPVTTDPTPTPTIETTPVIKLSVSSVTITYGGRVLPEFTLRQGELLRDVRVNIEPIEIIELYDLKIEWESSNEDQFQIVPNLVNGRYYSVDATGIASSGFARLIVTVGDPEDGGMEHSIRVYSSPRAR